MKQPKIKFYELPEYPASPSLASPPLRNSLEYARIFSGAESPETFLQSELNLEDLTDQAAARTNLGLGSLAIYPHNNISVNLTLTGDEPTIATDDNKILRLVPDGEGYVIIGENDTTHDFDASGDFLVSGRIEVDGVAYFDNEIRVTNSVIIGGEGQGLTIKDGANCRMGTAVLVGGTVTVNSAIVTDSSRIFLTCQTPGGTPGALRISARTANSSFTITSSSGTDTSTVAYLIIEPT